MEKIDKYDILISMMGYPMEGIDDIILDDYQGEIECLKEELGMSPEIFNLVLFDDNHHNQIEVIWDLMEEHLPEPKELMMEAHTTGSVVLKSGPYNQLKQIQDNLKEKNYKTSLYRIELE